MSGVSVEEGDKTVRVQTEVPHLVSLGGGRLSTAVTIHPLTQVITILGSGNDVDIPVYGAGVEQRHCYIQNNKGSFMVFSLSPLTAVDGVNVTCPARLTQGCILGLGHSNYFRFNHPVEARIIKSSLPDPKASLLPPTFYQGAYVGMDSTLAASQQQSPCRDSWSEITDILSKAGYKNGEAEPQSPTSNCDLQTPKRLTTPSPAFNRNPTPYIPSKTSQNSPTLRPKHNKENINLEEVEKLEQEKVDEILAICSEYERQAQLERGYKPVQNRIKTNGSLPRDKRLNSPKSPTIQHSFSFDPSELTPNEIQECERRTEAKKAAHNYENVSFSSGSPRPRIKTTVSSKETHLKDVLIESSENKIPVYLDSDHFIIKKPSSLEIISVSSENSHVISRESSRHVLTSGCSSIDDVDTNEVMDNDQMKLNSTPDGRPLSIAEANAESKYNFLGFDPRKLEMEMNRINSEQNNVPNNSDSTRINNNYNDPAENIETTTIDAQNYPDYEILDGNEKNISTQKMTNSKFTLPLDCKWGSDINIEGLKNERSELLKELTSLKHRVSDLEIQEEELIRESEMEDAFVSAEITAQVEKIRQEERRIKTIQDGIRECDVEMEKCLAQQAESQEKFRRASDKHSSIIRTLEQQVGSSGNTEELREELLESLSQQFELLDMEKKNHEDLEFHLMEEEAGWLSKREELQKELSDAAARLASRNEKLLRLQRPSEKFNNQLEMQRIVHMRSIEEGRNRLKLINAELQNLSKAIPPEPPLLDNCESTTDDEENNKKSSTSQDDLDRISRITTDAPIDMSCNTLGKRTIASLQEIERNRHLHLAKQGSLVIQEERQRVEELKRRVQDEVRAQWQQQRNSNCQSITSESSSNSVEPTHDSGVSSEEVEKRTPTDETKLEGSHSPVDSSDGLKTPDRPLSDASSYSDDPLHIKMRSRSNANLQRPLTRYLPIKNENLDLRQHIETAGHQVELCPHIKLDATSCRGYLHKMGSRFHHWNKRWFVFDRQKRSLTYYTDRSEKKQRGGAYFQAIEEVYVDHLNSVKSPSPKVTFVVKSVSRMYHLVAPSPEAMRIWVDVIFTGAEGYQQYTHHLTHS